MDRVEVTTVVHLPPEEVFEFLLSFRQYANYSKYLADVRQHGDGGAGTEYALRFEWWKLRYTARSEVTEVDPPRRIEWRLIKDLDASGRWLVEPIEADGRDENDAGADDSRETDAAEIDDSHGPGADSAADGAGDDRRTQVTFVAQYAPGSADEGIVDLPRFVSLGWVVDRVKPIIQDEAERVVRRVVADLEGEERDVELWIETA